MFYGLDQGLYGNMLGINSTPAQALNFDTAALQNAKPKFVQQTPDQFISSIARKKNKQFNKILLGTLGTIAGLFSLRYGCKKITSFFTKEGRLARNLKKLTKQNKLLERQNKLKEKINIATARNNELKAAATPAPAPAPAPTPAK